MRYKITFDTGQGYFTLNKAIKCISYGYQIIDKYAEFIKPPWLIGKASASYQGGVRVLFIVYNIILYNIILYNIYK